jgi:hypothetical protein
MGLRTAGFLPDLPTEPGILTRCASPHAAVLTAGMRVTFQAHFRSILAYFRSFLGLFLNILRAHVYLLLLPPLMDLFLTKQIFIGDWRVEYTHLLRHEVQD